MRICGNMSLPMKCANRTSLIRNVVQRQSPVAGIAANQLRYYLAQGGGNVAAKAVTPRSVNAFTGLMPKTKPGGVMRRFSTVPSSALPMILPPCSTLQTTPVVLQRPLERFLSSMAAKKAPSVTLPSIPTTDAVKHAFSADVAKLYSNVFEQHCHPHGPWNHILKSVEEVLKLHPDLSSVKILDIASGPGEPACTIAKRFPMASVVSTDLSSDMVQAARDRIKGLGLTNVTAQVADAQDLAAFDDATFDIVTCCYGFMFVPNPDEAFNEVHRVLKPGGTLVTTVWESMPVERASHMMMDKIMGGDSLPPRIIDPLSMSKPRLLEGFIEKSGLTLMRVDHDEYPFRLSKIDDEDAFKYVAMPIYQDLVDLVQSGERPGAFQDAKAVFERVVDEGEILNVETDGTVVTAPNRFKIAVARRQFEDDDKKVKMKRKKGSKDAVSAESPRTTVGTPSAIRVSNAFDSVLAETYSRINNGPWNRMVKTTERILDGHPDISKVRILDLGTGEGEPAATLALKYPRASVMATDLSPEMIKVAEKHFKDMGLKNVRTKVVDMQDLSSFKDGSFDVVTCCFGLIFVPEPGRALEEIHRVLRPGGSLITTVWDSISIERISDVIMGEVMDGRRPPTRVIDHLRLAKPRKLEGLIEGTGMSVINVDHGEFPFQLSGLENEPKDFAFNVATIPIHPNLVELQNSGKNTQAFEDAKAAFEKVVEEGELISTDKNGRLMTVPNRFKMVVARRQYEDADGVLNN